MIRAVDEQARWTERLRTVRDLLNLFSEGKWTPEGIRYHRRAIVMSLVMMIALVGRYLVTDWNWRG